jgi:hypothetical protein
LADLLVLQEKNSRAAPHSYHAKSCHISGREDRSIHVTKIEGKDREESDLGPQAPKKKKEQQAMQEHFLND